MSSFVQLEILVRLTIIRSDHPVQRVCGTVGVCSTVAGYNDTCGGYLEYHGGYHDASGGYLEYRGGGGRGSVPWEIS